MTKEQILDKLEIQSQGDYNRADVLKAMEEYAKEYCTEVIKNISTQPIQCYSVKEKGKDKQYFLGSLYIDGLIKRIKG